MKSFLAPATLVLPALCALLALVACAGSPRADTDSAGSDAVARSRGNEHHGQRPTGGVRNGVDEFHVQIPVEGVQDVMHAKLAHAQALLEGLALEDFMQVRLNATALRDLSREAGWRIHTTVAYGVHSDEFTRIVSDMIDHSIDRNLEAATLDFIQMTQSCVRCHSYMRSKGLYRDVPGAES